MATSQKIQDIEDEIARTQKNKATNYHIGTLKAKLAKLKAEILAPSKGGGGAEGSGFDVTKSGDARVGLIGFPSVGKSTLLSQLTGTKSEVAAYEFTTLTCIPGTLQYKGCRIQLLDLPGIIEGAREGKGRGRQVIGVARTCNLILIVLDAAKPLIHKRLIEHELEGFGIRMNKQPPAITIKRKEQGGLNILTAGCTLTQLDKETIKSICKEYRLISADITFKQDATEDDLIDVIEGNRVYVPCLYVMNKIDIITMEELEIIASVEHNVPIASAKGWGFDDLLEMMWQYLNMKRVYTKPKGQIPDYENPVILKQNSTVGDFCKRIHKALLQQFAYALVWGSSVKHNPQKVGIDHQLADEDIVQIIKKV